MKAGTLKRQGKRARINAQANKKIDAYFKAKGITTCEVKLPGCWISTFLTRAHKQKRREYYGEPEKLSDINEVVLCCWPCHEKMEFDKKLTAEVFERCRGTREHEIVGSKTSAVLDSI